MATPETCLPTINDVLEVKDILSTIKLPLEVIDVIVDFAEYWPHTTAMRKTPLDVYGSSEEENKEVLRTAPLCYDMVSASSL